MEVIIMDIYKILSECKIKECKLNNLERETILEFLSKNGGCFFIPQKYGPNNPLKDTDYHEFITSDGITIFIGYEGMNSFKHSYGKYEYDPSEIGFEDEKYIKYIKSKGMLTPNEIDELIYNALKSGVIWYTKTTINC